MKYQISKHPRAAIKQASWATTVANQARRVGQYGKDIFMHNGQFNPVQGIPRAIKRGYESTAVATSPTKQKNMIVDALNNMRSGVQVDDVATGMRSGGGIRQYLRDKGWLSVGRKTSGRYTKEQQEGIEALLKEQGVLQEYKPGQFRVNQKLNQTQLQDALTAARKQFKADPSQITRMDKVKDFAYNALPGEKASLVGFGSLGAGSELMSKETEQGRKKSLAERVGRAGVGAATETLAAPLGIARRFGTIGGLGEMAATTMPYIAMSKADQVIGNPAMKKQASIPTRPRAALRRALK